MEDHLKRRGEEIMMEIRTDLKERRRSKGKKEGGGMNERHTQEDGCNVIRGKKKTEEKEERTFVMQTGNLQRRLRFRNSRHIKIRSARERERRRKRSRGQKGWKNKVGGEEGDDPPVHDS